MRGDPPISRSRGLITPHTGLRGIAAFCVFMTHLGSEQQITLGFNQQLLHPFYWSDFAVDLFFMLSGFILNWVYFKDGDSTIDWKNYLRARCARILPLYYLTMLPFLPPTIRTLHFYGAFYNHGKMLVFLLANLFMLTGFSGEDRWDWRYNAPSWSISVEFLAYIALMPLLVSLFRRYREKALPWTLGISVVGALLCYGNFSHVFYGWNWAQTARGIFCFPLGFALCSLFMRRKGADDAAAPAACITAAMIMGLTLYLIFPRILILCVLPLFVYFTAANRGFIAELLNRKAPQWLGDRSYSIYLWHTPIMYVFFIPYVKVIDAWMPLSHSVVGIINMGIIIVSTLIVSAISYRFFETPVRNLLRGKKKIST